MSKAKTGFAGIICSRCGERVDITGCTECGLLIEEDVEIQCYDNQGLDCIHKHMGCVK